MSDTVTIAVVIPCYNSEITIKTCLDSVFHQSVAVDEVLVVDDGSSDQSVDYIRALFKKFPASIRTELIIQKNSGPSSARNNGVLHANSSHIAFLDADDEWFCDHIKNQKEFILSNFHYDIIASKYQSAPFVYYGNVNFRQLLFKNYFLTPCVVVNKKAFLSLEGFNEDMRYAEDYSLWLQMLLEGKGYVLSYLGGKNVEGKNIFGEKGLSSNLREMHQGVLECYKTLFNQKKIGVFLYQSLRLFEFAKYLRRQYLSR